MGPRCVCCGALLCMLTTLVLLKTSLCSKVLLLPMMSPTKVNMFWELGKELADKGHNVSLALSISYPYIELEQISRSPVRLVPYATKRFTNYRKKLDAEEFYKISRLDAMEYYNIDYFGRRAACEEALEYAALINEVKNGNFDLAIVDAHPHSACFYILLHKAGLRFVSYSSRFEWEMFYNPVYTSVQGKPQTSMSFTERLYNFIQMIIGHKEQVADMFSLKDTFQKHMGENNFLSIPGIASQSLLWLLESDSIHSVSVNTPLRVYPVIGSTLEPERKLDEYTQEFMNFLPGGVVVASFGNIDTRAIPVTILHKMLQAFKKIKYQVVWKCHKFTDEEITPRIMTGNWIRQNDLLGHPRTRLLITHAGANSQLEALYHGVPMVMLPLYGDQHFYAKKASDEGYGVKIDIEQFTAEDLSTEINRVIENASFKSNVSRVSSLLRAQWSVTSSRAQYWIDHVLNHGTNHLPASRGMQSRDGDPMIDVILVLSLVLGVSFTCLSMGLQRLLKTVPKTHKPTNNVKQRKVEENPTTSEQTNSPKKGKKTKSKE